jgi:aryl-alcohol dehydrogenase-like predicted oxidoreductase
MAVIGADREDARGIAEMIEAGHVRHIGLSEVGVGTLRRAAAVEYSLLSRGIEDAILPGCRSSASR